jgi:hypothetical protein
MAWSRRDFMQLLGLGGIATVGLGAVSTPVISLFGSDDSESDRAERLASLTDQYISGHVVVHAKRMIERVPPDDAAKARKPDGYQVVGRLVRHREPTKIALRREGVLTVTPKIGYEDSKDIATGHAAFYMASLEMRRKFAEFSRVTLEDAPVEMRPMASLVTIIDSSIHASPLPYRGVGSPPFELRADFRQFLSYSTTQREMDTFDLYSLFGEYPVEPPRDIDMGMLLKMDKEIVSERLKSEDQIGSFLASLLKRRGRV